MDRSMIFQLIMNYDNIEVDNILNIHKYFMKTHDMNNVWKY